MTDFNLEQAFGGLHSRFDKLENSVQDLRDRSARTETNLSHLIGNGQPGKITKLEDRISDLEKFQIKSETSVRNIALFWGGITGAIGFAWHFVWDYMHGKP